MNKQHKNRVKYGFKKLLAVINNPHLKTVQANMDLGNLNDFFIPDTASWSYNDLGRLCSSMFGVPFESLVSSGLRESHYFRQIPGKGFVPVLLAELDRIVNNARFIDKEYITPVSDYLDTRKIDVMLDESEKLNCGEGCLVLDPSKQMPEYFSRLELLVSLVRQFFTEMDGGLLGRKSISHLLESWNGSDESNRSQNMALFFSSLVINQPEAALTFHAVLNIIKNMIEKVDPSTSRENIIAFFQPILPVELVLPEQNPDISLDIINYFVEHMEILSWDSVFSQLYIKLQEDLDPELSEMAWAVTMRSLESLGMIHQFLRYSMHTYYKNTHELNIDFTKASVPNKILQYLTNEKIEGFYKNLFDSLYSEHFMEHLNAVYHYNGSFTEQVNPDLSFIQREWLFNCITQLTRDIFDALFLHARETPELFRMYMKSLVEAIADKKENCDIYRNEIMGETGRIEDYYLVQLSRFFVHHMLLPRLEMSIQESSTPELATFFSTFFKESIEYIARTGDSRNEQIGRISTTLGDIFEYPLDGISADYSLSGCLEGLIQDWSFQKKPQVEIRRSDTKKLSQYRHDLYLERYTDFNQVRAAFLHANETSIGEQVHKDTLGNLAADYMGIHNEFNKVSFDHLVLQGCNPSYEKIYNYAIGFLHKLDELIWVNDSREDNSVSRISQINNYISIINDLLEHLVIENRQNVDALVEMRNKVQKDDEIRKSTDDFLRDVLMKVFEIQNLDAKETNLILHSEVDSVVEPDGSITVEETDEIGNLVADSRNLLKRIGGKLHRKYFQLISHEVYQVESVTDAEIEGSRVAVKIKIDKIRSRVVSFLSKKLDSVKKQIKRLRLRMSEQEQTRACTFLKEIDIEIDEAENVLANIDDRSVDHRAFGDGVIQLEGHLSNLSRRADILTKWVDGERVVLERYEEEIDTWMNRLEFLFPDVDDGDSGDDEEKHLISSIKTNHDLVVARQQLYEYKGRMETDGGFELEPGVKPLLEGLSSWWNGYAQIVCDLESFSNSFDDSFEEFSGLLSWYPKKILDLVRRFRLIDTEQTEMLSSQQMGLDICKEIDATVREINYLKLASEYKKTFLDFVKVTDHDAEQMRKEHSKDIQGLVRGFCQTFSFILTDKEYKSLTKTSKPNKKEQPFTKDSMDLGIYQILNGVDTLLSFHIKQYSKGNGNSFLKKLETIDQLITFVKKVRSESSDSMVGLSQDGITGKWDKLLFSNDGKNRIDLQKKFSNWLGENISKLDSEDAYSTCWVRVKRIAEFYSEVVEEYQGLRRDSNRDGFSGIRSVLIPEQILHFMYQRIVQIADSRNPDFKSLSTWLTRFELLDSDSIYPNVCSLTEEVVINEQSIISNLCDPVVSRLAEVLHVSGLNDDDDKPRVLAELKEMGVVQDIFNAIQIFMNQKSGLPPQDAQIRPVRSASDVKIIDQNRVSFSQKVVVAKEFLNIEKYLSSDVSHDETEALRDQIEMIIKQAITRMHETFQNEYNAFQEKFSEFKNDEKGGDEDAVNKQLELLNRKARRLDRKAEKWETFCNQSVVLDSDYNNFIRTLCAAALSQEDTGLKKGSHKESIFFMGHPFHHLERLKVLYRKLNGIYIDYSEKEDRVRRLKPMIQELGNRLFEQRDNIVRNGQRIHRHSNGMSREEMQELGTNQYQEIASGFSFLNALHLGIEAVSTDVFSKKSPFKSLRESMKPFTIEIDRLSRYKESANTISTELDVQKMCDMHHMWIALKNGSQFTRFKDIWIDLFVLKQLYPGWVNAAHEMVQNDQNFNKLKDEIKAVFSLHGGLTVEQYYQNQDLNTQFNTDLSDIYLKLPENQLLTSKIEGYFQSQGIPPETMPYFQGIVFQLLMEEMGNEFLFDRVRTLIDHDFKQGAIESAPISDEKIKGFVGELDALFSVETSGKNVQIFQLFSVYFKDHFQPEFLQGKYVDISLNGWDFYDQWISQFWRFKVLAERNVLEAALGRSELKKPGSSAYRWFSNAKTQVDDRWTQNATECLQNFKGLCEANAPIILSDNDVYEPARVEMEKMLSGQTKKGVSSIRNGKRKQVKDSDSEASDNDDRSIESSEATSLKTNLNNIISIFGNYDRAQFYNTIVRQGKREFTTEPLSFMRTVFDGLTPYLSSNGNFKNVQNEYSQYLSRL